MTCKRGDVILVKFPNSDLKTYKKRPALVVQADGLATGLQQKIIALITSNTGRIAGLLYLIVVLGGILSLAYVPSVIETSKDSATLVAPSNDCDGASWAIAQILQANERV